MPIRRSLKKEKIICSQCKLQVKEEDDTIQCDKCLKTYHAQCTTLDKRQYKHLLENDKEQYVCHLCNEHGGNIREELNEIKRKLNKLDQLDVLHESIQFMSEQFDGIIKGIAENKQKLEAMQNENKKLKMEIKDLKNSVKLLNDNRVQNDCIINGIDVKDDVTAEETVINMMKDFGVKLQSNEIDEAYYLKNKNAESNTKSIVVKFTNKKYKKLIMSTKPKLMQNKDTNSIFINDYLSKETLNLLNYAKSLKTIGYRRIYSVAGRIFAKKSELSRPMIINNFEEVDQLMLDASKTRRSMRRGAVATGDPCVSEDESQESYSSPA